MANQIERLYGKQGLHGLAVSPGAIRSRAQRYDDPEHLEKQLVVLKNILKSTSQGAATQVWAAVGKELEGKGALYLEDCAMGKEAAGDDIISGGYAPFAFNEEAEKKLWDLSCKMVGIDDA